MSENFSNPTADKPEKLKHVCDLLHSSRQRREVFFAIYSGYKHFKSLKDIKSVVSKYNNKTSEAAAKLCAEDLIIKKKGPNNILLYGKIPFYKANIPEIKGLLKNPKKLKNLTTKRNPKIVVKSPNTFRFFSKPKVKRLYIDDLDSFAKVRKISKAYCSQMNRIGERIINEGICKILNSGSKNDWGGEKNDIFASININGKRISAAFALKGKATQGILVPGKMGKNGDQIQRLFESSAESHFIVYHSAVDEKVDDQMQALAISKSVSGGYKTIYFCIIDGKDLARLITAYKTKFNL
ncbi:MAG: hypothetical protein HY918_03335 [Candidatus Doudnabacteria bacterium]|nr:hypothetical protein [Candidatus Doudnabacteria bacterium]